jgi:hypothetical protein
MLFSMAFKSTQNLLKIQKLEVEKKEMVSCMDRFNGSKRNGV